MEEGLISEWLVAVGDEVPVGAALYEVETEKVTTEVEATLPGRLVRWIVEPQTTVPVGALIAVVADPGEAPDESAVDDFIASADLTRSAPVPVAVPAEVPASATPVPDPAEPAPAPAAEEAARTGERARAMPFTRRLAREAGVDIEAIVGTGREGLVTEADVTGAGRADAVETAADATAADETAPVASHDAALPPRGPDASAEAVPLPEGVAQRERRRLGMIARTMAQVTARSARQQPAFSQTVEVRVPHWKAARDALRAQTGESIGLTDMLLDAIVGAVAEVPEANSSFDRDALVLWEDVNVSIAVDSPAGLVVPVLKRAQSHDLPARARELQRIVELAREGRLGVDDVSGGTITLSNLGAYGIDGGVPLLTAPQSAIVFVGAVREAVVAVDGAIAVQPVISITTAFDHRSLDGATAARFTAALRTRIAGWRP